VARPRAHLSIANRSGLGLCPVSARPNRREDIGRERIGRTIFGVEVDVAGRRQGIDLVGLRGRLVDIVSYVIRDGVQRRDKSRMKAIGREVGETYINVTYARLECDDGCYRHGSWC